ncbi:hypothetical protein SDC9_77908 [bioreactor metagenome]|uniref:Uncharacterized protein n=1 Tax=bioreactor metagenome TaxID=1076179 RepID=A0A644YY08_9ZZZZ
MGEQGFDVTKTPKPGEVGQGCVPKGADAVLHLFSGFAEVGVQNHPMIFGQGMSIAIGFFGAGIDCVGGVVELDTPIRVIPKAFKQSF